MLVIKNVPKDAEGKWFYRDMWGGRIGVKIRQRTDEIIADIMRRFDNMPEGDEKTKAINDALWDHLVEDFSPIGREQPDGSIVPIPKTPEGKQDLAKIDVPYGEKAMAAWILDTATSFAYEVRQDELKN